MLSLVDEKTDDSHNEMAPRHCWKAVAPLVLPFPSEQTVQAIDQIARSIKNLFRRSLTSTGNRYTRKNDNERGERKSSDPRSGQQFQRGGLHKPRLAACAEKEQSPNQKQLERQTSSGMPAKRQFSDDILVSIQGSKGLRIRAGTGQHRFIGIWVVVVRGRVFVRSWSVKPNGWYRTFLKEPRGTIQLKEREIAVRAVPIKSEGLRDAIDRAYLDAYNTAGALKYAKDLGSAKSRDTTIELVPLSSTG